MIQDKMIKHLVEFDIYLTWYKYIAFRGIRLDEYDKYLSAHLELTSFVGSIIEILDIISSMQMVQVNIKR